MRIIMGLGNPGAEYAATRHNCGVMLVDRVFSKQWAVDSSGYGWRRKKNITVAEFPKLILVKTAGYFMNESGQIVNDLRHLMGIQLPHNDYSFYLAHDDLDLKLGEYKIQFGKGPKDHNGVKSVENALKSIDFWRIRIGIDNRLSKVAGDEYVLQKFLKEEQEVLEKVLAEIAYEIVEADS